MDESVSRKQMEIAHQAGVAFRKGEIERTPDYIIERFRRSRLWRLFPKEFIFKALGDVRDKQILDFGCGDGEISTQLARLGAAVTAIDISPELISLARQRAAADGVTDRIKFITGDIIESPLPQNSFDHLVCYAVIHHVDIAETMPVLCACLKAGGTAYMMEPTAFSPTLQRIRDMVPVKKDTSPVERQLNKKEIEQITGFFDISSVTFFEFFGRLQRLFPNRDKIDKGHPFTKTALIMIHGFDRLLITLFPFLWKFYGTAVIVGKKTPHPGGN